MAGIAGELEAKMEDGGNDRCWDELIPDALGLIFKNLPLQDVLTVIPRVCKSWQRAVLGPYCWQEIDIEEWSMSSRFGTVDRLLQLLITRSQGSIRKLAVSGVSSKETFELIADNAKYLQALHLTRCEISDPVVEQLAGKFSNVTFLDISYCIDMGVGAIEAFGKHCKNLTFLRRTMHPLEVIDKGDQDDEAYAIAATMPKLKQLEIGYMLVTSESVNEIVKSCTELEVLDIRGCWGVSIDESVKKNSGLKVVGPVVFDRYDPQAWENCSDNSGSSGYLPWDFVAGDLDDEYDISDGVWEDEEGVEDVQMWFYDGLNTINSGYDWPQSP
ncbi:PREDICTED: F-box protein FBW2-like isoform X2 [Ipomoea nil]|uniref:F-box protein FBW2-like isoform X2 n=1 Tax=Ipomoea nil TaxID=35883 RepID=UPI000900B539|nr:PREDICTED: F-box protein FBW2-like isoform X2 [Ipomoea nil]XP_019172400.1 PREDICTED: F-box protein FBW2-like isoform X2 [Ipomoea nil]XP_019172401.1 PREDICTED: F-box protein FBW2-like isoform X2 [Ipomoea nil]